MPMTDPILTALAQMEERFVERMGEWRREIQLDINGGFDAVHQRLDRLEQEYEILNAGVARLEADVRTLKVDVATLRVDVGTLKVDVATLKVDVATLKSDVAELKSTVGRLDARAEHDRSDRQDLGEQAVECRRRLDDLEGRVQEIEGRLPPE